MNDPDFGAGIATVCWGSKTDPLNIRLLSLGAQKSQVVVVERWADVNETVPSDHNFGRNWLLTFVLLSDGGVREDQDHGDGEDDPHAPPL
jgi:hypothetical protein